MLGKERLHRGDRDGQWRPLIHDAVRLGVDYDTARELRRQVELEAGDITEAMALFERRLATIAIRGITQPETSPGKLTRTARVWEMLWDASPANEETAPGGPAEARPNRAPEPHPRARAAIDAALGRVGITVPIAQRDLLATYYGEGISLTSWTLGAGDPASAALLAAMAAHCEHHRGCGHQPARPPIAPDEPIAGSEQALDDQTRRSIEHTIGRPLGNVVVRQDASLTARGRLGEAVGKVISLAPDVPGPDTELGRRVRLHEAAHIAQQEGPAEGTPAHGDRRAVEADAEGVAGAAARGQRRPVGQRAASDQTYGLGVEDVIGAAADALGIEPMEWMRQFAPGLAGFVDGGFEPLVQQMGDAASRALQPVLAAINPQQLGEQFTKWVTEMQASSLSFGVLTGCCECLDGALASALTSVQGALKSPLATQISQFLSGAQARGNSWLIDQIKSVTDDVTGFIDRILGFYESARAILGPAIQEVWSYIADALGLDKSLSPAAAIRKKLSELWDQALEAIEPIRRAIEDAWQFLCDETFIGDIVAFVGDCRKLVNAIQLCRDSRSRDPQVWLGILAQEMKGTVFEDLIGDLQSGYTTATSVAQAVSQWVVRLLDKLGVIKAWNSAVPAIAAIGNAIKTFAAQVEAVINQIKAVITAAMTAIADAFRALYEAIRPLLNFVVGFGIALMALSGGNPLPMIMFIAGNIWLYAVPDCYKAALANFVLDIFISVMEWLPATFPMVVFVRSAVLAFLRTLRGASVEDKITAMDMVARTWAGDIELIAGFVVGVFKGLWESTPGLIIRLALFSFTAPFQAMYSAIETLASLVGRTGAELAGMGEWVVDLMSRAQSVETDGQGNVTQGPFSEEAPAETPESTETEVLAPEIIEGAPDEDADAEGVVSSPDPDGDGQAPGQDEEEGEDEGDPGEIDDPVWEPLPAIEDLGSIGAALESLRNGFTREDIDRFLGQFNVSLDMMGEQAGTRVAKSFIEAMTARETPYRIGELIGTVVGFVAGEIIMLFIPVAGWVGEAVAKIPQIGHAAIAALRSFPMFIRALEALRAAVAPAMRVLLQFSDEIARAGRAVLKYFDDLLKWARTQFDNLMAWVGRNFPRLRSLLRRGMRRLLGGDDLDDVADEAAEDAWDRLVRQMGDAVYTEAEIQAKLNTIRVSHPSDVSVSLRMVAHRSSWEVRATARKGGRSKTSDAGHGWVTTAHDTRTPYYAPDSDWWNHHRVLDRAADDIRDWEPRDPSATFEDRYAQLRQVVTTEQTQGQDRLRMRGIQFLFEMEEQASVENDHECTITLILSPNASKKRVKKAVNPTPLTNYLGARRHNNTFAGSFNDAAWNWSGYPSVSLDRHPANSWTTPRGDRYTHDVASMPRPSGDYIRQGRTRSWSRRTEWHRHIDDAVTEKQRTDPTLTEQVARDQVMAEEGTRSGVTITDWDTFHLDGWEGHHIHEQSWDGPHTIGNIIFVEVTQHRQFTRWFEDRTTEIRDALGIPRWVWE